MKSIVRRSFTPFVLGALFCAAVPGRAQLAPTPAAPFADVPADSAAAREPFLSELSGLLSAGTKPLEVHLVFAREVALSEAQLAQGAAISQALALRAGYRPLHVSYGAQPATGKVNVLIGTADELQGRLDARDLTRLQRGYLSVRRSAGGLLLIVSGRTVEDINNAIISLGLTRERLPEASFASIREVVLPSAAPFFRREPLAPEATLTLEELQKRGAAVNALAAGGLSLDLFYPGWLTTDSAAKGRLQLHFSLRKRPFAGGTPLTVTLNGTALEVAGSPAAAALSGSEQPFEFPLSQLKPGRNVLEIRASAADELKVFADSTLTVPKPDGAPALPDLGRTARTFYPFVGQPDGSDFAVVLTDRQPETIASAFTLLAKLAQSANTFFFAAPVTVGRRDPARHNVVIGQYQNLPPEDRRLVALEVFQAGSMIAPVAPLDQVASGTNLKQVLERLLDQHTNRLAKNATPAPKPADPVETAAAQSVGVMASAPALGVQNSWVLVVTAFSAPALLERTRSLVEPAFWDQIHGDIVRWGAAPDSLQAHVPGAKVATVQQPSAFIELPLGERLRVQTWVGMVVGGILFFVITSAWLLGKFDQSVLLRQRRQP